MAEPGPFGPGSAGFVGGLVGGIGLYCRRRGTFPSREKYPKARFSVGHGLSVELSLRWRPLPLNMQNVGAFTPIAGRRGRRPERKKYQLLHFAPSAAAAQEIAEAPPVADEARRFRGSVPIGGREAVGNLLTRRCSQKRYYISCPLHGTFKHVARIPTT